MCVMIPPHDKIGIFTVFSGIYDWVLLTRSCYVEAADCPICAIRVYELFVSVHTNIHMIHLQPS